MAKVGKNFSKPESAKPIEPASARLFMLAGTLASVACAVFFNAPALWAAPYPEVAVVLLAALAAVTGAFGTFVTVGGLSEYSSLALPIYLASLLVLDWRHYMACAALGELFTFVSEYARRTNPTMWYVRCFNVCMFVLAGFGGAAIVRAFSPLLRPALSSGWATPGLVGILLCATLMWQVLDEVLTWILVTLAAGLPLSAIEFSARRFVARLSLLLVGIPFAFLWRENLWLALLTLAPLGKGLGLLGVAELEHRGQTDARTGLVNAGRFDELLDGALTDAKNEGSSLALLIADIDHFKNVNDAHGHPAGDKVIQQIAGVLSSVARTTDVAARIGGEEFALILPRSDLEGALSFAERLRRRVAEEPFATGDGGEPLSITTSVGVAVYPAHAQSATALYARADGALYAAKRSGRNRVCCAD